MTNTHLSDTKTKTGAGQISAEGNDQTRSGFETSMGIDNISNEPVAVDLNIQPGPPLQEKSVEKAPEVG